MKALPLSICPITPWAYGYHDGYQGEPSRPQFMTGGENASYISGYLEGKAYGGADGRAQVMAVGRWRGTV